MRQCTLVICYDYGKGVPSIGVTVNQSYFNGGPTINFFNAYTSTTGYHSHVYSETTAGKNADAVISLLLDLIYKSHNGCGWLLLVCDGEIKNINWPVTRSTKKIFKLSMFYVQ